MLSIEKIVEEILDKKLLPILDELKLIRESLTDKDSGKFIMTTAEVCSELQLTPKSLIQYENEGLLKKYQMKPGGRKHYKRPEVYSFMNSDLPPARRIRKKIEKNPFRVIKKARKNP